jgi:hypothetical protein
MVSKLFMLGFTEKKLATFDKPLSGVQPAGQPLLLDDIRHSTGRRPLRIRGVFLELCHRTRPRK